MSFEVSSSFLFHLRSHPSQGSSISVGGYTSFLSQRAHRSPPPREEVHRSKSLQISPSSSFAHGQQDVQQQFHGDPHLLTSYTIYTSFGCLSNCNMARHLFYIWLLLFASMASNINWEARKQGGSLEEISTQNGPPKENNKIIFINFGGRKEKNYFFCS